MQAARRRRESHRVTPVVRDDSASVSAADALNDIDSGQGGRE